MDSNSENKTELFKALFNLQKEILPIKKTADNPFFHSKYADISTVLESVKPLLQKNKLVIMQPLEVLNGLQVVKTVLLHESGESMESVCILNPEKDTPQGYGSAITYMRRYSLISLLGLATEDDDGNMASQPSQP